MRSRARLMFVVNALILTARVAGDGDPAYAVGVWLGWVVSIFLVEGIIAVWRQR